MGRWFGHLHRISEERMVKKVYKLKPMLRRPLGRPKNRWEYGLAIYIEYQKREWLKKYINGNRC